MDDEWKATSKAPRRHPAGDKLEDVALAERMARGWMWRPLLVPAGGVPMW